MAKNNKGTVEETYTLPSLGKFYPNQTSDVSIRSMTTFEEKMRLGNQGFYKVICNMLDATVTSPEDFDASSLTLFDFRFMMYKMRTVSYGPIYKVTKICPYCGHQSVSKINLDDLEVQYIKDDAIEPFDIGPLPRSGDVLGCRHLRVFDLINNEKQAKEILRKNPDYVGDPTYILNMASQICTINGEEKTPAETRLYVEKMLAMDSAYFEQAYNKEVEGPGLQMEVMDTCSECGEDVVFDLPINSEFFRPTFDF